MRIILEWRAGFNIGACRVDFDHNSVLELNSFEEAMTFIEVNNDIICRWYVGKFITPELLREAQR